MHAVQSALAIRRERERRQSLKSQRPSNGRKASTDSTLPPMGAPSDFRSLPESNGTFNYTTVGVSFIIFGSLMLVPIFAGGHEVVGLDWRHLLGKTLCTFLVAERVKDVSILRVNNQNSFKVAIKHSVQSLI